MCRYIEEAMRSEVRVGRCEAGEAGRCAARHVARSQYLDASNPASRLVIVSGVGGGKG